MEFSDTILEHWQRVYKYGSEMSLPARTLMISFLQKSVLQVWPLVARSPLLIYYCGVASACELFKF